MLSSVNPYLCPILGVRVHRAEARIGGCTIMVFLSLMDVETAFPILEFLCFASKNEALANKGPFVPLKERR
jgi:hypothetical protein